MIDFIGVIKTVKGVLDLVSAKAALSRWVIAFCLVAVGELGVKNNCFVLEQQDRDLISAVHTGRETAGKDSFALSLFNQRIQETRDGLERKGTISIPAEDLNSAALKMMSEVKLRMEATSSAKDWWKEKFGNEYLQRNNALGGLIRRYFLYENLEELVALRPVLEAQSKAGIQVYVAPLDRSAQLVDYVIIDDRIAGELPLNRDRNPVRANFYFDKDQIERIKERIAAISVHAERFVPSSQ